MTNELTHGKILIRGMTLCVVRNASAFRKITGCFCALRKQKVSNMPAHRTSPCAIRRKAETETIMKKRVIFIALCVVLILLTGCSKKGAKTEEKEATTESTVRELTEKDKQAIEAKIQELSNAFLTGDMDTVNEVIFRAPKIEENERLAALREQLGEDFPELTEEPEVQKESVLASILSKATITQKSIALDAVTCEVKAPDMEGVFEALSDTQKANITEDELLEHIKDYGANAETKTTTVTLPYLMEGEEILVDYQDATFLNAVTGGLMEAYKCLYEEMLSAYTEGA